MGVRGRDLEGTTKGAKERQQLSDGGQGALCEEGELQMLCGRVLTQPIQSLKTQDMTSSGTRSWHKTKLCKMQMAVSSQLNVPLDA